MGDGTSVKSLKRLAMEVGAVCLVSLVAGATLVHFRNGSSASAEPTGSSPDSAPAEETPSVPASVDVDSVAFRARARVEIAKTAAQGQNANDQIVAHDAAIERLKRLRKCEKAESSDCPVGSLRAKSDPYGYYQLLTEETVSELAFLKALAMDDLQNRGETHIPVLSLSNAYIKHPDDNVREQALGLATLLSNRDADSVLQIASRALRTTVSGPLTTQALRLMAQSRSANPGLVDKTLREILKTGGWDVRNAVAAEILPFITHENRNSFAQILAEAPARSKLALHLRLGLEEFDRMERL